MVDDVEKPKKCPLCGTGLKIPLYRCRKCAKDYEKAQAIISKDGRARCPKCNSFLKGLSFDDVKDDITCKECGITISEMNILRKRKTNETETKSKKKLTSLEDKLEILSKEIDKILSESDDEELIEEYLCPSCGTEIDLHCEICPKCGMEFVEVEEVPEGFELEVDDFLECSECKAMVDSEARECPKCGMVFAEDELFACPTCDQVVDSKTTVCPKCKTEFVPFDEELESALDNLTEYDIVEPTQIQEGEEFQEDTQFTELMQILVEPEEGPLEPEPQKKPESPKPREKPYHSQTVVRQVIPKPSEPITKHEKQAPPRTRVDNEIKEEPIKGLTHNETPKQEHVHSRFTKGLSNGLSKGRTNGMKAYNGRLTGMTNGRTNGVTNGLTNGLRALRAGITNGLTNGNGITNGLKPKDKVIDSKRVKTKLIAVPCVILLLVFSPYIMVNFNPQSTGITIDGTFGDWRGVATTADFQEGTPFNPNVDIVNYKVDSRNLELSLYLEVEGVMLAGETGGERRVDTAYVFMDRDIDSTSGYLIKGMGADYMMEIYGWNQEILGTRFFAYEDKLQDWNLWQELGFVSAAVKRSELEVQIPYSTIYLKNHERVDILFYMQSWDMFDDYSDFIVSNEKGALVIAQTGVAGDVISGPQNRLLKLEMEAVNTAVTIEQITLTRTGKGVDGDVGGVRLENEVGNLIAGGTLSNGKATLNPYLTLQAAQSEVFYITVDIGLGAHAGNSIGFDIDNTRDISTNHGAVTLERIKPTDGQCDTGYIINIPDNVTIDGAFGDWNGTYIQNDTDGDTIHDNLDITGYGVSSTETAAAFYLRVDEDICGGAKVPYWNKKAKRDTIVHEGPGGGIGPEIKPKTGEDVVFIFIDTVPDIGYSGSLPLSADYLIEVTGRHNKILTSTYYQWTGAHSKDWQWSERGSVHAELDSLQMELELAWNDFVPNQGTEHFEAYFWTTNWDRSASDYSDGPPVVTPTGTRAETLSELAAGVGSKDNDRFGWNVSYAGDVNNDGYPDLIVGAPYNDTSDGSKADAGAVYIFFGYPEIDSSNINAANANVSIFGDNAGDHFGWSVSDLGNVDSDTKDDIIMGAPDAGNNGKAYIFYGRTTWSASYTATSADVTISGQNSGDKFGCSVSGAGNFDSSNYNDIIIGAYGYNSNTGRAYLFYGDGTIPISAGSADKTYTGEAAGDMFGFSVSTARDVDNDGKDDVIIGAPCNDGGGANAGRAYIYFGGDKYVYVDSNTTTKGYIFGFNNAKSASDSGAYAILREEDDGETGGSEYLYVDGWDGTRNDWVMVGSSPYLNAVDNTNRIYTNTGNAKHGEFTFQDTTLTGTFSSAYIELYSKQAGDGEYIEVLLDDGTGLVQVGTITPNIGSYTWKSINVSSYLDTRAKVDGAKMRVVYEKSGSGDIVDLDCARINYSAKAVNLYKMEIEFNTTNVPPGANYYLQLNYSTDGSETQFIPMVYNTGGSWDDLSPQGTLSSISFTQKEYTLSSSHRDGLGNVRVLFIGGNETNDVVNSTLNIEYHRIRISGAYLTLSGENAGDLFGYSVANCSDINEDGYYEDIIIGAPGYGSNKGRAYIFHGSSSMDNTSDLTLTGYNTGDKFGFSVSGAGDLDGDGKPDVIVGAPYWDKGGTTDCGTILVYRGGSLMDTIADYTHNGTQNNEHFGWSVCLALNINGGTVNAVAVGAPHFDSGSDSGRAELLIISEFSDRVIPLTFIAVIFMVMKRKKYKGESKKKTD